jgi:hypothetical protein
MRKEFLNEIVEMRLLTERMEKQLSLVEVEERRKELLCEMAFNRQEFKDYLMHQSTTIISHFALIKYAKATSTHLELLEHLCDELKNYIVDFQEMDTKPKSGNRNMVYRALSERWITNMELTTHPQFVIRRFDTKFKEENIVLNQNEKDDLANAFISQIPTIIHEMAYGTEESAMAYVRSL